MKKLLLLVAFLFTFFSAYAQKVYVGVKGGVNSSTLTGSDTALHKKRMSGINVGILANVGISDLLSLQPEITYSQQGIKLNAAIHPASLDNIRFYLNYINATLLIKAMFGGETIRGFINIGPYIGYMINGKFIFLDVKNKAEKTSKIDFKQSTDFKRLDFGGTVGIGTTFRAGPGDIVLDFRYSLGTIPVSKNPPFKKYTNSIFSGSIGYVVPLGEFY